MWPCLDWILCVALKYRDTLACLLSAETPPAIGNCLHTYTHKKIVKYCLKSLILCMVWDKGWKWKEKGGICTNCYIASGFWSLFFCLKSWTKSSSVYVIPLRGTPAVLYDMLCLYRHSCSLSYFVWVYI